MYKTFSLLLTLGMVFSLVQLAEAGTITLGWDRNTESNLAGYKLYYGERPRSEAMYPNTLPINNKLANKYEITLPGDLYFFALTAVDSDGNESGFSNELKVDFAGIASGLGAPGRPYLVD
jgi:hypothetical protein